MMLSRLFVQLLTSGTITKSKQKVVVPIQIKVLITIYSNYPPAKSVQSQVLVVLYIHHNSSKLCHVLTCN